MDFADKVEMEVGFKGNDEIVEKEGGIEDLGKGSVENSQVGGQENVEMIEKNEALGKEESVEGEKDCGNKESGVIDKRSVVWWKMPIEFVRFCVFRMSPVMTVSVAAAMMGFVILGRRLYTMKKKTRGLQLKVTVDDKSKKNVEGSLFVVKRDTNPRFQFIVMNRKNTVLAFILPILESLTNGAGKASRKTGYGRAPGVLVLLPTRELAVQVFADFQIYGGALGLSSCCLYGGSPYPPHQNQLKRGVDIVIGTPSRIKDHIERGNIDFRALKFRVLDEDDEMLKMGFVDDVELILGKVEDASKVQTLLFSATLPDWVKQSAKRSLVLVVATGLLFILMQPPIPLSWTYHSDLIKSARQSADDISIYGFME